MPCARPGQRDKLVERSARAGAQSANTERRSPEIHGYPAKSDRFQPCRQVNRERSTGGRVYNRSAMAEIRVGTSAFTACGARDRVCGGSHARDEKKVCDPTGGGNFSHRRSGGAVRTTTQADSPATTARSSTGFRGR